MRRESLQKGVAMSIALSLILLIIIVFTPSFSAVKLSPGTPNKSSVTKNTIIIFNNVNLTIRSTEAIPVTYLIFRIFRSSDDSMVAQVNFSIFGTEISDTPTGTFTMMNVTNTSSLPYNSTWGYGHDEETNTSHTFNYGYGYGPSGSFDLSIVYRIAYTTHITGTFYAKLFVNSTTYTYVSGESTAFTVSSPPPPSTPGGPPSSNEAPVADADGPYIGYVNTPITVTGADSTDDTAVTGYRWDWTNDGTYDTNWSTAAMTTHIFTQEGGYTVRLQVRDSENLTDSAITTVNVLATSSNYQAPVADAISPSSGLTHQNIQFDGSHSYGFNASIVNYTWAFDDGTHGYDVLSTHAYETNGTFTVTLTITDSHNLQAMDIITVTIEPDENRNGIPDIMDHTIGADITQDDIRPVSLNGVLYYLVDTNADDIYDTLYNPTTNTKNNLGQQDDKQLIDINIDGHWDYLYDPTFGTITPYTVATSLFDAWWISVLISIVILVAILMVSWAYMTGRI
jgi:PKD repeat protein